MIENPTDQIGNKVSYAGTGYLCLGWDGVSKFYLARNVKASFHDCLVVEAADCSVLSPV